MKSIKSISVLIFFSIFSLAVNGQQVILTSGDGGNNKGASVSYSIGQIFQDVSTDSSYYVRSGIQQSYQLIDVSIEDHISEHIQVTLYPNPVVETLYIAVKGAEASDFMARLLDEDGKVLSHFTLHNVPEVVEMNNYLGGKVYVLMLYYKGQLYKSYRLIKKDL